MIFYIDTWPGNLCFVTCLIALTLLQIGVGRRTVQVLLVGSYVLLVLHLAVHACPDRVPAWWSC